MYYFVIKEIREEKSITLKELSQKTGLSISYLSRLQNNKVKDPSFSSICKISYALQEEISKLYINLNNFEDVRNILDIYSEKYGLTDSKTINISKIADKLAVENMISGKIKSIRIKQPQFKGGDAASI